MVAEKKYIFLPMHNTLLQRVISKRKMINDMINDKW